MENRKFKKWSVIKNLSDSLPFCIIHAHGEVSINSYANRYPDAFSETLPDESVPLKVLREGYETLVKECGCNIADGIINAFAEYGIGITYRNRQGILWNEELKSVFALSERDFNLFEKNSGEYIFYSPPDIDKTHLLLYKDDDHVFLVEKRWVILEE